MSDFIGDWHALLILLVPPLLLYDRLQRRQLEGGH